MVTPSEIDQRGTENFNLTSLDPDPLVLADSLLEEVQEGQIHSTAEIETRYSMAFAEQVEVKHDQAERIEDRIESLIEKQESALQQLQSAQPGLIALPGSRSKWQAQLAQQQSRIQMLHARLESVREIKDGLGFHGPRIEDLAKRRLQVKEPELFTEWKEFQEAQRLHQFHQAQALRAAKKRVVASSPDQAMFAGISLRVAKAC